MELGELSGGAAAGLRTEQRERADGAPRELGLDAAGDALDGARRIAEDATLEQRGA